MATPILALSSPMALACFSIYFLSYTFANEDRIRLNSDDLHDGKLTVARLIREFGQENSALKSMYQFGDSITDTGNYVRDNPECECGLYPYGKSYFNLPTGRCSDGLIIPDFLANMSGLPFLDAFLNKDGNFTHGVNFAVAGASALDASVLLDKFNLKPETNLSLSVQLGWFKSHLKTICTDEFDCSRKLSHALVMMGEIGGNDYNAAFSRGWSLPQLYEMVPTVVQKIGSSVKEVIDLGAKRIIVPGNFPVGCMTINLVTHRTSDATKYDELNCLEELNDFAMSHNNQLQETIKQLQEDHPDVQIVYMDNYTAFQDTIRNAGSLGFDKDQIFKTCCGAGGGDYNFDRSRMCGSGAPVCENPYERLSWDGIHPTQHAYQAMTNWFMRDEVYGISNKA